MLEDDSGRIQLVGDKLKDLPLVTGCIIAVMGTETASGELDVAGIKFADLPPQPERWSLSKPPKSNDEDVAMSGAGAPSGGPKVALVSGLSFSGKDASHAAQLTLLLEFLLGEALDPAAQRAISKITRLVIAGNSVARDEPDEKPDRKTQKKYGYDASAYNPAPFQLLDGFLAEILPSIPVTIMPGADDPATAAYPQQPVHPAMFPGARAFAAEDPARGSGWFDCVTNPWEGEVEGWRFLGTGGQNVDDVFKYIGSDDRLGMMEGMCRWRCIAPTAPDTLCKSGSSPFPPELRADDTQGPTPSRRTSPSSSSPARTSTSSAPSRASPHGPSTGRPARPSGWSPCRRLRARARSCCWTRRRWRRRL